LSALAAVLQTVGNGEVRRQLLDLPTVKRSEVCPNGDRIRAVEADDVEALEPIERSPHSISKLTETEHRSQIIHGDGCVRL